MFLFPLLCSSVLFAKTMSDITLKHHAVNKGHHSCPVSNYCIKQEQGFEAQEEKAWEQTFICLSHTKKLKDFQLLNTKLIH